MQYLLTEAEYNALKNTEARAQELAGAALTNLQLRLSNALPKAADDIYQALQTPIEVGSHATAVLHVLRRLFAENPLEIAKQ